MYVYNTLLSRDDNSFDETIVYLVYLSKPQHYHKTVTRSPQKKQNVAALITFHSSSEIAGTTACKG